MSSRADSRLALPGAHDTIAAVATPPGRGALAIIRLSGPGAHTTAARLLKPWRAEPRVVYRAALRHPETGALIDRPLVTVFTGPRSYTGDDMVELSVHGGAVAPTLALAALVAAGAREALPGEFTRRAVANGKMDILQAEAVADLVDARSRAMHHVAVAQLDGGLSRRIAELRESVIALEALIAYDIDFPEEDEGPLAPPRVIEAAHGLLDGLDALLATARTGEVVRAGALVVIAGPPNAGKSSLFNALLGYARAIVTDIPGTTRDALEAVLDIGDWPVRLVDTAGLRESVDVVERLGVEVSERYLADAELVLACSDSPAALAETVHRLGAVSAAPLLPLLTKADQARSEPEHPDHWEPSDTNVPLVAGRVPIPVSAHTGSGLDELTRHIGAVLAAHRGDLATDAPLLTRERHHRAVRLARDEVARFADAWHGAALPPTVSAVHLRAAAAALESLIGAVDVEDVLDRVFRTFCVGK